MKTDSTEIEFKTIMDMSFKFGDWVNTLSNFFFVLNIAVIGWLLSSKKEWSCRQIATISLGYVICAGYINYSLARTFHLLELALGELKEAMKQGRGPMFHTSALRDTLQHYELRSKRIICGYLLAEVAVLMIIILINQLRA